MQIMIHCIKKYIELLENNHHVTVIYDVTTEDDDEASKQIESFHILSEQLEHVCVCVLATKYRDRDFMFQEIVSFEI